MGDEAVAATDTACSWMKLCYRMKQEPRAANTRKHRLERDFFFFSGGEETCFVHSNQDLAQCWPLRGSQSSLEAAGRGQIRQGLEGLVGSWQCSALPLSSLTRATWKHRAGGQMPMRLRAGHGSGKQSSPADKLVCPVSRFHTAVVNQAAVVSQFSWYMQLTQNPSFFPTLFTG